MAATELPPRFPCWCKATYSWGGETKKDLGFIEGDLIEALNAGDGLWWMGRLRRDPRAIGLFPSNFVQVLDESFRPAPNNRNASPLTLQAAQKARAGNGSAFRKPFQAYEEAGRRGSVDGREKSGTPEVEEKPAPKKKLRPYSSMKVAQTPASTQRKTGTGANIAPDEPQIPSVPPRHGSITPLRTHGSVSSNRPASSARNHSSNGTPRTMGHVAAVAQRFGHQSTPSRAVERPQSSYQQHDQTYSSPQWRAHSPQPDYRPPSVQPSRYAPSPSPSRPASPLPSTYHDGSAFPQIITSRQPSPVADHYNHQPDTYDRPPPLAHDHNQNDFQSSPPPLPPAHRVTYQPSRVSTPQRYEHQQQYENHPHTPMAPSPSVGSHMTPSPLRDAMNDVMMSLQDMSTSSQSPAPVSSQPLGDIWSPEAFDLVRTRSQNEQRANAAMHEQAQYSHYQQTHETPSLPSSKDGLPHLSDYVERMEHQLQEDSAYLEHAPQPPLKGLQYSSCRPGTSGSQMTRRDSNSQYQDLPSLSDLRHRKSAFELGTRREALSRSYTTKTNATNSTETSSATQSSTSTQLTSRSIMSGASASGMSATSAGSLSRHKFGLGSQRRRKGLSMIESKSTHDLRDAAMSQSSGSGPSYHESHASYVPPDWTNDVADEEGILGGLGAPRTRKSGFFKKMIESAKTTARASAATARSTITSSSRPGSRAGSPTKPTSTALTGFGSDSFPRPASSAGEVARSMGIGNEWMQVRRDINRSNSLSRREVEDRMERCELLGLRPLRPVEYLQEFAEGDEGLDGLPLSEPMTFHTANLALVDRNVRFLQSVPPMITAGTLAQNYVCRPYKSDVQRLRAIFTYVAERIAWEEDFEGQLDTRRVLHTKRGCSEEIAMLVLDMCAAVGLHCEVVRGHLKRPGEALGLDILNHSNHWWNAVIVDGEWRAMDCSLASPTHPHRSAYSSAGAQAAEPWYFLARPLEICYTHIPLLPEQQHIVPPLDPDVLAALPCATPTHFKHGLEVASFDTSMLHLDNLEMAHIHVSVPEDVECVAETEARAFAQDADGDFFESGDSVRKPALAQVEWVGGRKRYTIKALLPGDEGQGSLKIYAGKRGLMHSIRDNPHALAVALPLSHQGQNPPYDFVTRHPTPHAQRHDLYIAQPQCARLSLNNTFVFCVRQHPSSLSRSTPETWGGSVASGRPVSPNPMVRPGSAMSMVSASITGSSQYSDNASNASGQSANGPAAIQKPAKLAIQTPSQKIIRLTRKLEHPASARAAAAAGNTSADQEPGLTTSWETVIKIGERGVWRGLVLADRSARWCVFAEWTCE